MSCFLSMFLTDHLKPCVLIWFVLIIKHVWNKRKINIDDVRFNPYHINVRLIWSTKTRFIIIFIDYRWYRISLGSPNLIRFYRLSYKKFCTYFKKFNILRRLVVFPLFYLFIFFWGGGAPKRVRWVFEMFLVSLLRNMKTNYSFNV